MTWQIYYFYRYSVKVTEDHLTSIQINTSKSDVSIKLVVLNNEEEVASTLGKGHAVIPAFTFLKDINPEEDAKRSTSRNCKYITNKQNFKGWMGKNAICFFIQKHLKSLNFVKRVLELFVLEVGFHRVTPVSSLRKTTQTQSLVPTSVINISCMYLSRNRCKIN